MHRRRRPDDSDESGAVSSNVATSPSHADTTRQQETGYDSQYGVAPGKRYRWSATQRYTAS